MTAQTGTMTMTMRISFSQLRFTLYAVLGLFSVILLGLCSARIDRTTSLRLDSGVHFDDAVVSELLFTSIVTLLWSIFMLLILYKRWEHGFFSSFLFELLFGVILWLLWLGGAVAASVGHSSVSNLKTASSPSSGSPTPPLLTVSSSGTRSARDAVTDIQWCQSSAGCQILDAVLAFAWIGWITLGATLVFTLFFVVSNEAAHYPVHAVGPAEPDATRRSGVADPDTGNV